MRELKRIYYLDFIRSVAMIAGIFFHSSLSFLKEPVELWPVHDNGVSTGMIDLFTWASHRVRMPLFFIVCGFFTWMLFERYDLKYFIKSRLKRIFIPFIISLVLIVPLTIDTFITDGNFTPFAMSRLDNFGLMHLWFLYFLIIFYIITLCIKSKIDIFLSQESKVKELLFTTIIVTLIFNMKDIKSINPSPTFIPDIVAILFYFTFYLTGAYFYKNRNIFKKYYSKLTVFLFAFTLIATPLLILQKDYNTLIKILTSIFTITTLVVAFELSNKYFNKRSKIIKYFSDSSYWLYLIHIPIVVTLQNWILKIDAPKDLKFLVTSLLTLIVSLISYHLFIRYTVIGNFLHGKRTKIEVH